MNWLEKSWYKRDTKPFFLLRNLELLYLHLAKRKTTKEKKHQWQPPVPVILVGNINIGGTGKTPLVIYLVELLQQHGYKPGVISRGYKSKAPKYPLSITASTPTEHSGDEPAMIYKRCNCPVVIAPNRIAAATKLLQQDCNLIISDDGLQHQRLGRDIEIVVLDGKRGLGNQHCLPAGPLREPANRLSQVDFVVTTGEDSYGLPDKLQAITMKLQPTLFKSCNDTETKAISQFKSNKLHAMAGIGNPQRFFDTLRQLVDADIMYHSKPDHHTYSMKDFELQPPAPLIMTEKDAIKVADFKLVDTWYLEVSAQLPATFDEQIIELVNRSINNRKGKNNG